MQAGGQQGLKAGRAPEKPKCRECLRAVSVHRRLVSILMLHDPSKDDGYPFVTRTRGGPEAARRGYLCLFGLVGGFALLIAVLMLFGT